jgi:methylglutaconyl-CoA hydratase
MTQELVLSEIDGRGVASVVLNRPEVHNAYDGALIDQLGAALETLGRDPRVRVVVLRGQASTSRPAPI